MSFTEEEISAQVPALTSRQASIAVVNPESYTVAAAEIKGAKTLIKEIKEFFKPLKAATNKAHKAVTQKENLTLAPVQIFVGEVQAKMVSWQAEQDRIRQEREFKLQEKLRKQEENERLLEAEAAEAVGDKALAEEIISEPIETAPVVLKSTVPKVAGVSYRETWKAEVIDLRALVKYVAEHLELIHLIKPADSEINRMARAQKSIMSIPGIRAFSTKTIIA